MGDDLFDFDFEVEPVLSVLIGKTLEQSMLEVMQEEELASLEEDKIRFEAKKNSELAEIQRLEAEEKRRFEEKENRKKQEIERVKREKETMKKIISKQFAFNFVKKIEDNTFNNLKKQGYFYDVIEREVETKWIPNLLKNAQRIIEKKNEQIQFVDILIKRAVKNIIQQNI